MTYHLRFRVSFFSRVVDMILPPNMVIYFDNFRRLKYNVFKTLDFYIILKINCQLFF